MGDEVFLCRDGGLFGMFWKCSIYGALEIKYVIIWPYKALLCFCFILFVSYVSQLLVFKVHASSSTTRRLSTILGFTNNKASIYQKYLVLSKPAPYKASISVITSLLIDLTSNANYPILGPHRKVRSRNACPTTKDNKAHDVDSLQRSIRVTLILWPMVTSPWRLWCLK
jgi:hypothetical protein